MEFYTPASRETFADRKPRKSLFRKFDIKTNTRAPLPPLNADGLWEKIVKFYLIPDGEFLYFWDRFIVFVAYINGLMIPFLLAFQSHSATSLVFSYIIDVVFLADIFVKFHVAYLQNGFWVTFPKDMAKNYVSSWRFKFDVVTNLPLEVFAIGFRGDEWEIMYLLSMLRLNKWLRTLRLFTWFYEQEQRLYASYKIQIAKFFCYLTIIMHSVATIWYMIACPPSRAFEYYCYDRSWVSFLNINRASATLDSMYIHSFYWTVTTMTTTGYGDIRPDSDIERLFAGACMIIGSFLFGYVSGTIASSLSNLDSRRIAYRQKIEAVMHFMNDRKMERTHKRRVLDWYDYMWERNKGIMIHGLLDDMPISFRSEISMHLNKDVVSKASIFTDTSPAFQRVIATMLRFYLFTANEYVVQKGDAGHEMYVIIQGRVDIFNDINSRRPLASLVDGSILGEYNMVLGLRHEIYAMAICNTDVYALSKDDLDKAFDMFPEDRSIVVKAAEERRKKFQLLRKSKSGGAAVDLDEKQQSLSDSFSSFTDTTTNISQQHPSTHRPMTASFAAGTKGGAQPLSESVTTTTTTRDRATLDDPGVRGVVVGDMPSRVSSTSSMGYPVLEEEGALKTSKSKGSLKGAGSGLINITVDKQGEERRGSKVAPLPRSITGQVIVATSVVDSPPHSPNSNEGGSDGKKTGQAGEGKR